jgi:hypothetical protein
MKKLLPRLLLKIPEDTNQEDSDALLINVTESTSKTKLQPGDIRRVMGNNSKQLVNLTQLQYIVSYHKSVTSQSLSLVDRSANGGVAGNVIRVIFKTSHTVDIRGIENHQVPDIDIGTDGGITTTHKGPVIGIMHQYPCSTKAILLIHLFSLNDIRRRLLKNQFIDQADCNKFKS